jgi:SecD/SecF fusion protein
MGQNGRSFIRQRIFMNRPLFTRFLVILACLGVCAYYLTLHKINLGLDLRGGTSYTLELDLSGVEDSQRKSAIDKAGEILRKRVDHYGVAEPIIQPVGENRINVQIPGLEEAKKQSARAQLERVAKLELRLVHPQNESEVARMKMEGRKAPAGYELLALEDKKSGGNISTEEVLVKIRPEIIGSHLTGATPHLYPDGWQVEFRLSSEGSKIFSRVTRENVGNRLAIVLDKKLMSAPQIKSEISGSGVITGDFSAQEAAELANVLQNPLETPVKIVEERGVDPTLGDASVQSGYQAGVISLVTVIVFMGAYYLKAGFIAIVTLFINLFLLFGVLSMFQFTLTLPGIAGIILTVGTAVDSNVLIYERIREELRKGKPLIAAIDAGFSRATATIIDANVTTLITALILVWLGTGPVQGFGVTLSAGICTSVFATVFVSRFLFDLLINFNAMKKLKMLSIVKETNIPFLSFRWPALLISMAIILGGALMAYNKGNDALGVDFTGGDSVTLEFKEKIDSEAVTNALQSHSKETLVQYQREIDGNGEVLSLKVPFEHGEKAVSILQEKFPNAGFTQVKLDKVGGVIGDELKWTAIKGLLVAALLILVYVTIRFEFAFAVGAIVSLAHDLFICLAFFFFTERQLSLPAIGALLTIAGYSLNDTIVIFDRIREELKLKGQKVDFVRLINLSINQTLGRTLLTALTTFVASIALFIYGGGVINDFAFILVVGVIAGTYSSVFIACTILLLWHPSKLIPQERQETTESTVRQTA